jgi:DNA gyrase subunit B/topoisomerase-4 subunit B
MTTASAKSYTAESIQVLEGLEPVRKRPGMYIGGVSAAGLHHLVWEILDNSVDEAMNGHASEITVTLHDDGTSASVADNGRGIPVDPHPKLKKPALEVILTTLHAGGKFDVGNTNYKTAGGLHGVGASVVNALSKTLIATVKRDGQAWEMTFHQGKTQGKIKLLGPARGSGTSIFFHPDPTIFPKIEFSADLIRQRCEITSYLHRGVKVVFVDETSKQRHEFKGDLGLEDYLKKILAERGARPSHAAPFVFEKDNGEKVQLVLQWTESTDEHVRSYVNGIPTASGGTHELGLRAALNKAVRNFIETHNLTPRGLTLTADDIREGVIAVLSLFIADPQFQGQTKDRLNNPEIQGAVDNAVRPALEHWLNHNRTMAEQIVGRIILAARARQASRAASEAVTRKTATSGRLNLPGKLADCGSNQPDECELFIVEGDSAGGSAKQGRDRETQAILPLRGKVLNTESASLAKVLENKEIADVVTALGCGMGKAVDLTKLRYGKIILLADADSDGHHITTLLLTFLYRHLRELIGAGHVFIAQPPLYRIDIGKETHWAADDADRDRILAGKNKKPGADGRIPGVEITRFKGLGEMMPKVLWDTTLNPATRRLLQVNIDDVINSDRIIADLMGKDAAPRFQFIMARAEEAQALDV